MKERILEFLRIENKSSALFAEEIGVQPSGISHILSGRNNPSLDFVVKMLSKYPSLSAEWLLFGRGQMFREGTIGDLFDSYNSESSEKTNKLNERELNDSNRAPGKQQANEMEVQVHPDKNSYITRAKRIICFFDNNTFSEYFPVKD